VVLCLDITIVVIWLLIYARHYADVAMIVGGVWAAILGTIGRLRIRTKETSLSAFLGLPPVRATIATYSVLIVGAVPLFALAELPIHRVTVVPSVADGTPSLSMTVLRGVDTTHARTGPPDWRFYARRGRYVLRALPEGHEEWSHSFQVGWFGLSQQIELPEFRVAAIDPPAAVDSPPAVSEAEEQTDPEPGPVGDDLGNRTTNGERPRFGTLNVRSTPAGVDVWVSGEHVGVTPLQLERAPGTYTIELKSRHVDDARFGYHATGTVRVRAGDESGFETDLDPVELPTLLVRRGPDATDGVYYLDSVTSDGLLGQISGAARTFVVFPGDRLVLKKVGDTVTECSRVTLSAGQQEQIVC
jgi:hypothetical protein